MSWFELSGEDLELALQEAVDFRDRVLSENRRLRELAAEFHGAGQRILTWAKDNCHPMTDQQEVKDWEGLLAAVEHAKRFV